MIGCPCRRCNPGPYGAISAVLVAGISTETRVRCAVDRYVMFGATVEMLERDLDELLGITHARHETEVLRRELARLVRRQRVRAWLA